MATYTAVSIALATCLFNGVNSKWVAPARAEITVLPGWTGPLPSKQYNGWINAGEAPNKKGDMFFHYWFIESENDPINDPVVLWYNGGPGASSLFGLLVELGPLMLNEQSMTTEDAKKTGVPSLIYNKYGWSRNANLLIVDNPPPIGFSFCEPAGPTAGGTSCGSWDDGLVADANYNFIQNWFKSFPTYLPNKIFLTGESYAGIYVPTIMAKLEADPHGLNLGGLAVGDGCMGTEVLCGEPRGPYYNLEFMHGHGQFSNTLYNQIAAKCPQADLKSNDLSAECKDLVAMVSKEVGGYYGYNLYDDCNRSGTFGAVNLLDSESNRKYWGPPSLTESTAGEFDGYSCPGTSMSKWLSLNATREALHTVPGANFFSGDNGVGFNYTLTEKDVRPLYKHAFQDSKLKVLVYNGDTDPGINSFVTQDIYTDYLANESIPVTQPWRPWTLAGGANVAGYVTTWEGGFQFLTIRGSGHMVPEFKARASSVFITAFIQGTEFPKYVAPKTPPS